MKKIKQENGWDEVTTKCVRFDGFVDREFMKVHQWTESKLKFERDNGRRSCCFCGVRWENCDPDDWTGIVQTTKGNKILCQYCLDDFNLENTYKKNESSN